jgi:hypothetical protein
MSKENIINLLTKVLETDEGPELMTNALSAFMMQKAEQHPDLNPYPARFEFTDAKALLRAFAKQPTPTQATERAHAYHGDTAA